MGGRGAISQSGRKPENTLTVYEQTVIENKDSIQRDLERAGFGNGGIADYIPQWILDREVNGLRSFNLHVIRETEKAILVNDEASSYGAYKDNEFWVAKSQLQSAEKTFQDIQKNAVKYYIHDKYSNYLRKLAKNNNIKIGNLSSWDKITKKLNKNGINPMSKNEFQESKVRKDKVK